MLRKIRVFLEMIKFEHTVFALPFALTGSVLAGRGLPSVTVFGWVLVAMVGARSSAMAFNRIVDRKFDAKNPRTADRALPAGQVSLVEAWALTILAAALFFWACSRLNPLTLQISPLALGIALGYSLTKRFTWVCHLILGLALAFSPLGGWVAVRGDLTDYPVVLSLAVLFWVAGFDTIYACLDADFDRSVGLFSLPSRFGRRKAFLMARIFHGAALILFVATGFHAELGALYYGGLAVAATAMLFQHKVVAPGDMSRIHLSFFTMNGIISLLVFGATLLDLALGG